MMSTNLHHYLTAWELSDPQPLAETATSRVYAVTSAGTRVVLKLLTPIGVEDEQNGVVALRHFKGRGAVQLVRHDEQAHLLEYADGENLTALVERGEDERATAIIGDLLNQLHSAAGPMPANGLTPLRQRFASLFRQAQADRQNGLNTIFVRAAQVADDLLAHPQDVRVLHGDIHHYNIRRSTRRSWLAYDPKGLIGERTYDAANTLRNPDSVPDVMLNEARLLRHTAMLADIMGCNYGRVLAFVYVHVCLSACWDVEMGISAAHDLQLAAMVEPHVKGSVPFAKCFK